MHICGFYCQRSNANRQVGSHTQIKSWIFSHLPHVWCNVLKCYKWNSSSRNMSAVESIMKKYKLYPLLLTYTKYNWMIYPIPWVRGFGLLLVRLSDWKPDGYYSLSVCKSIPQKMKLWGQNSVELISAQTATDEVPRKEITNVLNRRFLTTLKKKATQWLSVLSLRFRSVNATEDLSSHILLPTNRQ